MQSSAPCSLNTSAIPYAIEWRGLTVRRLKYRNKILLSVLNVVIVRHLVSIMKDSALVDIGLKLKEIRKRRGLTQQQAATKASILRQDVSKIESGSFVGAISTLNKYLQFSGLQLTSQAQPSQFVQLDDLKSVFDDE